MYTDIIPDVNDPILTCHWKVCVSNSCFADVMWSDVSEF